jgi:hypothetical protein
LPQAETGPSIARLSASITHDSDSRFGGFARSRFLPAHLIVWSALGTLLWAASPAALHGQTVSDAVPVASDDDTVTPAQEAIEIAALTRQSDREIAAGLADRIRVDDRSKLLHPGERKREGSSRPAPAPTVEGEHAAPERAVENLVSEERGATRERDLLDTERPIE